MAQLICHHLSVGYDSKAVLTDLILKLMSRIICALSEKTVPARAHL